MVDIERIDVTARNQGYYKVYVDGDEVSQHIAEREAEQRAINEAIQNPDAEVIYRHDYEVDVSIVTVAASGGVSAPAPVGESGYTATHYVAPYSEVSGASNDYDDLGASSWSSATSSGTPTTLGTAMARAVAGNQVRVDAGVYVGGDTDSGRWIPSFMPANSGSSGSPIIFFARYPAAYNMDSSSLYTELRKSVSASYPTNNQPVLGTSNLGRDYIIFDGFYSDESQARCAPNGGIFHLANSTGSELRRCFIDRGNGTLYYITGFNANVYYMEGLTGGGFFDCAVRGFVWRDSVGSGIVTQPAIETYNSINYYIRNCYLENYGVGILQKESDNGVTTIGTFENNFLTGGYRGLLVQQGTFTCRNNICVETDLPFHGDGGPVDYQGGSRPPQDMTVYNNVFGIGQSKWLSGAPLVAGILIEDGMQLRTSDFYNNIVYIPSGAAANFYHFASDSGGSSSWDYTDFDMLNYNCYYRAGGGTDRFMNYEFDDVDGLSAWRTETSHEANSIVTDPEFTDYANGDYTLANNGQDALSGYSGDRMGAYITGSEEIGLRANPTY